MAKKNNILIKIVVDSREKNNTWIEDDFKFDKKYGSDKIKIEGYMTAYPMKCLDENGIEIGTSTGDISIIYSLDDGETWYKTNLSIELKKGTDFMSTLYSDYKRFKEEIKRAKEYGLDFYLVYNQSTRQMITDFNKLKYRKRISYNMKPEKVIYDRMIELVDNGVKLIYSHQIDEVIRRIIKCYIKKNKLQY